MNGAALGNWLAAQGLVRYRALNNPLHRDEPLSLVRRLRSEYQVFLQTLHTTAENMVQPFDPEILLDLLLANVTFCVIRRLICCLMIPVTDIEEDDPSTRGSTCHSYRSTIALFEISNKTLSEVCEDLMRRSCSMTLEVPWVRKMFADMTFGSASEDGSEITLVEALKLSVDRVELMSESELEMVWI